MPYINKKACIKPLRDLKGINVTNSKIKRTFSFDPLVLTQGNQLLLKTQFLFSNLERKEEGGRKKPSAWLMTACLDNIQERQEMGENFEKPCLLSQI